MLRDCGQRFRTATVLAAGGEPDFNSVQADVHVLKSVRRFVFR